MRQLRLDERMGAAHREGRCQNVDPDDSTKDCPKAPVAKVHLKYPHSILESFAYKCEDHLRSCMEAIPDVIREVEMIEPRSQANRQE